MTFRVFTKPETRDPAIARRAASASANFQVFTKHETRNTRHETRITAFMLLSLLSCALWSGMGRLWRGMGGMGRPEPLSAHRPHRQQDLSGFHETRDTRHESRLFFESQLPCPRFPGISRYFSGGGGGAPEQVFKRRCGKIPQKCAKSRIRGRLHGVYRQPRLPPPSRLLGLRPTPNNPMLRKENILYRVEQCAYDRFFYPGDRDEPRHVSAAWDDRVAIFWLACISHHVARRSV